MFDPDLVTQDRSLAEPRKRDAVDWVRRHRSHLLVITRWVSLLDVGAGSLFGGLIGMIIVTLSPVDHPAKLIIAGVAGGAALGQIHATRTGSPG